MVAQVQRDQWYVQLSYLIIYSPVIVLKRYSLTGSSKSYRVILVLKVQVAILDPLAHQDLKEALVSLVSKDSW